MAPKRMGKIKRFILGKMRGVDVGIKKRGSGTARSEASLWPPRSQTVFGNALARAIPLPSSVDLPLSLGNKMAQTGAFPNTVWERGKQTRGCGSVFMAWVYPARRGNGKDRADRCAAAYPA